MVARRTRRARREKTAQGSPWVHPGLSSPNRMGPEGAVPSFRYHWETAEDEEDGEGSKERQFRPTTGNGRG
jgi:hypothetical protein